VIGTDVVAPPGKIYGRYTRPHIRFGKPLDFSRYQGMESDRYVLRSITDEIMYEIMLLSGQEYVDVYATKAKEDAKAAAAAAKAEAKGAKAAKVDTPPAEPPVVDPPADIPPAEPPAA
jgi:1-acyl-sn-glycerol-3-phosphate acyltransferase